MDRLRHALLGLLLPFTVSVAGEAEDPFVISIQSGDTEALIEALREARRFSAYRIRVLPTNGVVLPFEFGRREVQQGEPDSFLPRIVSNVGITLAEGQPGPLVFRGDRTGIFRKRLAEIGATGTLEMRRVVVEGFDVAGNGGGFHVGEGGTLRLSECVLSANTATGGVGGGIHGERDATIVVQRCLFNGNASSVAGGAIANTGNAYLNLSNALFVGNAAQSGCAILQDAEPRDTRNSAVVRSSTFAFGCELVGAPVILNRAGALAISGSSLIADARALRAESTVRLYGNLFARPVLAKGSGNLCDGGGEVESLGFNLSDDDSCGLDAETDQPSTDANAEVNDDGVVVLKEGSGAIEGASAELQAAIAANLGAGLPCGYKDARNLGRPQDADLDGTFQCDIGDYEVQGGPNLKAAQSAAYLDPDRPGEGVFLELLGDGRAFAGFFSYRPDVAAPAWFVGIGQQVGNSVVFDEMLEVTGGSFGAGFDPNAIVKTRIAAMSMVFSTCAVGPGQGKLAFQADEGSAYEDLLADSARLSTVVPCSGQVPVDAGRSGSFFDPARDGEGIFVQWLPDGRVVLIWYTFDPNGEPLWIISGDTVVSEGMVRAKMLYPVASTRFGADFDPDEIGLADWGEVTLSYEGCNALRLSYDSVVDGFGSGGFDYVRLTSLDGTTCP